VPLCVDRVRFARHTERLDEVVRFYRDGLGLPELGRFEGHDGYDGVFLDLPNTNAHLEFTTGGGQAAPPAHAETLLVLYFDSRSEVEAACARLGCAPVEAANPYWRRHGVTVADPDGFHVVLVASDSGPAP
jgi:catechol 2,3-dioxygenase-like lactoylglutathione lyase family enzyme